MKRLLVGSIGLLLSVVAVVAARVDADPNQEYPITPEAGPWCICAASYRGPDAPALARELALFIRSKHQMPAYVFDHGKKERDEELRRLREFREKCPEGRFKGVRVEQQFAVMVGGYNDRESARKALDDFKRLPPPPDKLCDFGFVGTPTGKSGKNAIDAKPLLYNPFHSSFVAHNPTVPQEQDDPKKELEFLKNINAGESLSLLSNRKPWTLVVKQLQGACLMQPGAHASENPFLNLFGLGNKPGAQLGAAGVQAHELAQALRQMKPVSFEAYVLHTRTSSIVTVGGYDSPNDPKLLQDQQTLSKLKLVPGPTAVGADLQLLPLPPVMQVPGR